MSLANGRGILLCNSCTTVNDFSVQAKNYVLAHEPDYSGQYWFVVYNPDNALLAQIRVTHFYDRQAGLSFTRTTALTGSVADMQQAYRVAFPDLGATWIPASVAATYTGTSQQGVVGTYLANYYANSNPVQSDTTLAVFPDHSSAVYQLSDAATSDWTMVPNSGHNSNGKPLNDDAQSVVSLPPPPETIVTPFTPPEQITMSQGPTLGYVIDAVGLPLVVQGIIYCMVNSCTHIQGN